MSPSSIRIAFLLATAAAFVVTASTAASFSPTFVQKLLASYHTQIRTFFPSSALNSTRALADFLSDLSPTGNVSSSSTVEAVCNASLPVESCLERLPADARTRLLLVGDFLSAKGELNEVEADCVAKVAPVLLRDSSASSDG